MIDPHIMRQPLQLYKLRSSVSKGSILSFSIGTRDNCLLLTVLRYKRIIEKDTITSCGALISGIPSPISIKICYQIKKGRTGVVKALKQCTLDIMNDAKHNNIVSSTRSRHELTHNMNNISNIKMSNSKIYKTTNQLMIKSNHLMEYHQWLNNEH